MAESAGGKGVAVAFNSFPDTGALPRPPGSSSAIADASAETGRVFGPYG